jgi:hypothetical protein
MGCSGLTLSRSILSLSDSWRNSAVGTCDSSAALVAADTAHPFEWVRAEFDTGEWSCLTPWSAVTS